MNGPQCQRKKCEQGLICGKIFSKTIHLGRAQSDLFHWFYVDKEPICSFIWVKYMIDLKLGLICDIPKKT